VSEDLWTLACVDCATEYRRLEARYRCECGGTLDVVHHFPARIDLQSFDARRGSRDPVDRSGVWRFRELVLPLDTERIVTKPEGNTNLYPSAALAEWVGLEAADRLWLKHEGENPTGSFKDRGMTVAVSVGHAIGLEGVACASTGNTSASMAAYAAQCGMRSFVFLPEGRVAFGKLSQALAYGARTIQIRGNFDTAMALVEQACKERGTYLVNSLPGGNLGNSSAIAKGLIELHGLGAIPRLPRLAIVQAAGANPLYRAFRDQAPLVPIENPSTLATAIRIGSPISWKKALRGLTATNGLVEQATDDEILDAKAKVDAAGIGAEPASCAAVAGLRKLIARGVVGRMERVAVVLTGHLLKDPDAVLGYHRGTLEGIHPSFANPPIACDADLACVLAAMD
jgi:threonine synthase